MRAHARAASGADEAARALTFAVLVVASRALIQANRRWMRAPGQAGPWNAAFGGIALATLSLLALVLWVPGIAALFAFAVPAPGLLAAGTGLCLLAMAWFEVVRRIGNRTTVA